MSRNLKATEEDLIEMRQKLEEKIFSNNDYSSAISFSIPFKQTNKQCLLTFSSKAFVKMRWLVDSYTTEVQWCGIVERVSENEFHISDIVVPPHVVTAVSVTTDQQEWEEWCESFDDETYIKIKMHGHSHVNMSVAPSGLDIQKRQSTIALYKKPQPNEDLFYIFMIINKRQEMDIQVFDVTNNTIYDTEDVQIEVAFEDGTSLVDFEIDCSKLVKEANQKQPKKKSAGWVDDYYGRYGLDARDYQGD